MKNLTFFSALFLLILLVSACNKTSGECTPILYDTPFTIIAGETYCLPDGAELAIHSLNNEFCPCFMDCIWEGQMTLDVTWTDSSGTAIDGSVGTHRNNVTQSEELPDLLITVAELEDSITFVTDCTQTNPSPEIIQAVIEVIE